jgi:hypothetical protein
MQSTAFCLTPVLPKLFRPRGGNDSAIQDLFGAYLSVLGYLWP